MGLNAKSDEWKLLKNFGEAFESDIICSILEQMEIPILKKSRGSGAYTSVYMGMSLTGYDIYVPASRWQEAREVLGNENAADVELMAKDTMEEPDTPGGYILRYREVFKKLLLIFIVIPALAGLLWGLYHNLQAIFS